MRLVPAYDDLGLATITWPHSDKLIYESAEQKILRNLHRWTVICHDEQWTDCQQPNILIRSHKCGCREKGAVSWLVCPPEIVSPALGRILISGSSVTNYS